MSTELNTYGTFWSDLLGSAFHYHHQSTNWGKIFWNYSVYCFCTASENCRTDAIEADNLWRPNTLLRPFILLVGFFPLCFKLALNASVIFALKSVDLKKSAMQCGRFPFSLIKWQPPDESYHITSYCCHYQYFFFLSIIWDFPKILLWISQSVYLAT